MAGLVFALMRWIATVASLASPAGDAASRTAKISAQRRAIKVASWLPSEPQESRALDLASGRGWIELGVTRI